METQRLPEGLAPGKAFGNLRRMGDAPTSPLVPAIVSGAAEDDATLGGALRGLRVLLVDDDSDTLELLDAILTTAGVEVACATSVAQAFELLVAKRPNVIISDIEMPHENGHSFLRNLRSVLDEDGAQTPAIALSGRTRPEDRERGLASGFNLYLTKPTTAVKILRAVQAVAGDVPAGPGVFTRIR
jgi:CheY-like chemotaxis protein